MRTLNKELENRIVSKSDLLNYGFTFSNNMYVYEYYLVSEKFKMIVIYDGKNMLSKLVDLSTQDEYLLVDVVNASGNFIGKLRSEYENKIDDIIKKCTKLAPFKSVGANRVISYIKDKYKDELEFLWDNSPNNAIWRHKENGKWYGLLTTLNSRKLGLDSNKEVDIINLNCTCDFSLSNIDNKNYFPAYHMNKKHWVTIKLDGSISDRKIYSLIDNSYELTNIKSANKNKR